MSETTPPAASRRALLAGALGVGVAAAVAQSSRDRRRTAAHRGGRTEAHGGGLHTHVDGVAHRHPMMVHEMGLPVARPVREI
jgi:hypothetical protein